MAATKAEIGTKVPAENETHTPFIVGESCGGKAGSWYCVTCKKTLENQFMKDSHIMEGNHEMAWICPEHGLEVP